MQAAEVVTVDMAMDKAEDEVIMSTILVPLVVKAMVNVTSSIRTRLVMATTALGMTKAAEMGMALDEE